MAERRSSVDTGVSANVSAATNAIASFGNTISGVFSQIGKLIYVSNVSMSNSLHQSLLYRKHQELLARHRVLQAVSLLRPKLRSSVVWIPQRRRRWRLKTMFQQTWPHRTQTDQASSLLKLISMPSPTDSRNSQALLRISHHYKQQSLRPLAHKPRFKEPLEQMHSAS